MTEDGALGVGEFFIAEMVAAVVDEFLSGSEGVRQGFPRESFLAKKNGRGIRGCPDGKARLILTILTKWLISFLTVQDAKDHS